MDELAKRAEAAGGWEELARLLDAKLSRTRKSKLSGQSRGRPKTTLSPSEFVIQYSFPFRGTGLCVAEYVRNHRDHLWQVFGVLSDRTLANIISKMRLDFPAMPARTRKWADRNKESKVLDGES